MAIRPDRKSRATADRFDRILRRLHLKPLGSSNADASLSQVPSPEDVSQSFRNEEQNIALSPGSSATAQESVFKHKAPSSRVLASHSADLVNYELLECLGEGGQGVVYKASERAGGQLVAIKLLHGNPTQTMRRYRRSHTT